MPVGSTFAQAAIAAMSPEPLRNPSVQPHGEAAIDERTFWSPGRPTQHLSNLNYCQFYVCRRQSGCI